MPNFIAKFSLILAYLLNLSGALLLTVWLAYFLNIFYVRLLVKESALMLLGGVACRAMFLGFILALIVSMCSKNRLISDYAAYLMRLWGIGLFVGFWSVCAIVVLAAFGGSGGGLGNLAQLIGLCCFFGLWLFMIYLTQNVWALSGEEERPRQQKSQHRPKFVRNKNHVA